MKQNCRLCEALNQPSIEIYDKVLYEYKRFAVLPCIGPLAPGHVMIVSRTHHPNLGSMGVGATDEYEGLLAEVRTIHPLYSDDLLEAEHGALETQRTGACIVHAHVHWIPGMGKYAEVLDPELEVADRPVDLSVLARHSGPYVWVRGRSQYPTIYIANDVPSQLVRRRVTEAEGRDDWDWAVTPRFSDIKKTIDLWQTT